MIVRKITNISEVNVTVGLKGGNGIIMHPGAVLENIDVSNLESLKGMVQVVQDLSEVPVSEGRMYLKG